ncbi:MAG: kelch repeat-containing protein [Vicinamibacterales bacterium]
MKASKSTFLSLGLLVQLLVGTLVFAWPAGVANAAGTFVPTSSMSTARQYHRAAALADGTALVTGGLSGGGPLASAEIYHLATGTFSATVGEMTTPRYIHTATLLGDGTVLITGGGTGGAITASAEIYRPATGTFSATVGEMTTPRYIHTATLLGDGTVLITGGYSGSEVLASAEIYNPTTGTFSGVGAMSTPRNEHTATLLVDGRVLITGGYGGGASAEVYDPETGSFSTVGAMGTERYYHTATGLIDGTVLIIGGRSDSNGGEPSASAEIYNPAAGTFSEVGAMSTPRALHTATLLADGTVLVIGGFSVNSPGDAGLASAEIYNPATGVFSEGVALSTPRFTHTATLLGVGSVLVAGGLIDHAAVERLASAEILGSSSTPPTSDAGLDQSIHAGTTVHLNGGQSYDDNTPTDALFYSWTFLSYPGAVAPTLTGAHTATPSFVAALTGNYVLRLVVTDEAGHASAPTSLSDVLVSSNNQAPTAAITATPAIPYVGQAVALDGTGSTDPEHDLLTYSWSVIARPNGSTATAISGNPTTILVPDVPGTYKIRLSVGDFVGAGTPATLTVEVSSAGSYIDSALVGAANIVKGLSKDQVASKGNQKDFLRLLRNAIGYADRGSYCRAERILDEAISRTDGFPLRLALDRKGDGRDWIIDATAQAAVYAKLLSARNVLAPQLNCGEIGDGYDHHVGDGHDHHEHYDGDGHKHGGPDSHDNDD